MVNKKSFIGVLGAILIIAVFGSIVSAGIGISWSQETSLVPEKTKTCLTYKIYNPWPEDSYVQVGLSDSLMEIADKMEADVTFIPKETSSSEAIPVEFCFKTPRVYEEDCALFNSLICKQECGEEMKIYSGEFEVMEAGTPDEISGAGGSTTSVSAAAPLKVKVQCLSHSRDYSFVYLVIAIVAGILLAINLRKGKSINKKRKRK
jgi:hypothetical protein